MVVAALLPVRPVESVIQAVTEEPSASETCVREKGERQKTRSNEESTNSPASGAVFGQVSADGSNALGLVVGRTNDD
jgi:hypothetical protein